MATPHSSSRESSVSRPSLSQRPSLSRLSNPNVFSDDFALSSRGNSPETSPVDSIDSSSEGLPVHASSQQPTPPRSSTTIPPSHLNTTNFSRPSSTSKRPVMFGECQPSAPHHAISSVSRSDAATQRSSSVSSRLSIARAQSPYSGPTAPSHPYAMYPQVTRTSSIASESTIRPVERPYVNTGGPEHPYGMYPQNTVEEEDDDDTVQGAASSIPLGFPGMGQIYRGNEAPGHDLGDIVGHDGHVEQLPPYTRYADNTIAKASSHEHVPTPAAAVEVPPSPAPSSQSSDSDVQVNTAAARDAGEPDTGYNEKSKTRRRLRRKVCWGISLCVWLLVIGVVVIASTLGGVIGGVIGNNRASEALGDQSTPTATTTVWLDAAPLPTGMPPPDCTPGNYNMPTTNNSLYTSSCISDYQQQAAWGCLQEDPVPFWISYLGSIPQIKLGKPGPGSGHAFDYGAQVPDLNGSSLRLIPSIDKDDPNAGGTMFVHVLYNKLTVVHQNVFSDTSKRSMRLADLEERSTDSDPLSVTDKPYFCWFNQTLLELFIYSNLSTTASAENSTSYVYPTPTTASSSPSQGVASISSTAQTASPLNINQVTSPATTTTPLPSYVDTYESSWPTSTPYWPPSARLARRDDGDSDDDDYGSIFNFPIYPKQIRLAEKRAPSGDDVTPYCVQMEINPDWSVCEIDGTRVNIAEVEPGYPSSRRLNRPRHADSDNNLDSDCACQWYST